MRTLGLRTHALLAVAAAVGVVAALARPWYAAAPPTETAAKGVGSIQGPVDSLAAGMERWISQSAGTTGWDALGVWGTVIAALAGVTALGALGCLVPALQGVARELLRYSALACVAIVVWKLIDTPGPNAELELRFGAFVAAAAAAIAFSSGSTVASTPLRHRRTARAAYAPPPVPPRYDAAGSAPAPGEHWPGGPGSLAGVRPGGETRG
jgi:hypothetical protein